MTYVIKFQDNENNPPNKLADAEIHFTDGLLVGMKLIGLGIWQSDGPNGGERYVTFPARTYSSNGEWRGFLLNSERRSFSLLRPANGDASYDSLRDAILDAYVKHEARV